MKFITTAFLDTIERFSGPLTPMNGGPLLIPYLSAGLAALALLTASTPAAAQPTTAPSAPRPNIIFILADDLGYGDLSCFGQKRFTTPNLDKMAQEGTRLTNHYAASPVCVPTRASLMLGVHTGHSPVRDHQFDRAIPNTTTMASVLKLAGYHTMAIGKWGIGGKLADGFPAHPMKRGFDGFYGPMTHAAGHVHYPDAEHKLYDGTRDATAEVTNAYSTDLYTAKAKQWIGEQARSPGANPFFLYLAYIAPHSAFDVPDGPYPAGGGLNGGVGWPLRTHPEKKNQWINPLFEKATYDDDKNSATPEVPWTEQMKRYATMVRRLDDAAADLLQTLRDLKIDKNTLIVFSSDNGPAYDQKLRATQLESWGPLDGFKRDLSEGGMREPTIVWWPGTVKAGVVSDRPSVQYDWLPTFADLAGIAPPAATDGISLAPQLTGRGTSRTHDLLYWEFHGPSNRVEDRQVLARRGYNVPPGGKVGAVGGKAGADPWGQQQAVRIGDYVGLRARITKPTDTIRLYNVALDPKEKTDLAAKPEHADLVARIQQAMLTEHRPQPGNPRPYDNAPLPALTREPPTLTGLETRLFAGQWSWAPDTRTLNPLLETETGTETFSLAGLVGKPGAAEWTGFLRVPTTGRYELTIDGGKQAHLWLHDSALIDSEADTDSPRRTASVLLAAGLHPVRILVTTETGSAPSPIRLTWTVPGGAPQPVPATALLRLSKR